MLSIKRTKGFIGILLVAALVGLAVAGCGGSSGQKASAYPDHAIKLVVTHGPGSTTDMAARLVAEYLQKYLKQPIVVENREGAGGRVARAEVFKAKADGYTLLATGFPSTQLGELLFKGDYKTAEFSYIYNFIGDDFGVLYVAKDSPYKTFQDLLNASKTKKVVVAVSSLGAGDHLGSLLLREKAGFQHQMVPFEAGQMAMAVIGHQVDAGMDSIGGIATRTDVRPLLVLSGESKRSELLPDVPTAGELGFKDVEVAFRIGLVGPPGLPNEVVKVLSDAMDQVMKDPQFVEAAKKASMMVEGMPPDQFKGMVMNMYNTVQSLVPMMQQDMQKIGTK